MPLLAHRDSLLNAGAANNANLVLNAPAGAKAGDLLLAEVLVRDTGGAGAPTITTPSGWALLNSGSVSQTRMSVYSRVMQSGDANWTWVFSTANADGGGSISAYAGVDASSIVSSSVQTSASSTASIPTIDANFHGVVVAFVGHEATSAGTTPTGYTSRVGGSVASSAYVSVFEKTAYQLAGTVAATTSAGAGAGSLGMHVFLRAAQVPNFRASSSGNFSAASTVLTLPTAQIGDLQLLLVQLGSGTVTHQGVTGFTQVGATLVSPSGTRSASLWTRTRQSGDTNPTLTLSGTAVGDYRFVAFAGASAVDVQASATNNVVTLTAPTVTSTVEDDVLITVFASDGSALSTAPAGMTADVPMALVSNYLSGFYSEGRTPTGATGTRALTLAAAAQTFVWSLALRPPVGKPKIRSVSNVDPGANAPSILVPIPSSVVNSDFMTVVLSFNLNPGTITAPGVWSEIEAETGADPYLRVYTRVASSEPASYTWSWVNSVIPSAILVVVAGGGAFNVDGRTRTASSATASFPSITPTVSAALVLFFSIFISAGGQAPPVGAYEIVEETNGPDMDLGYEIQAVMAATGARTATGAGGNNQGYVIALAGNSVPDVPTNLQRTGDETDTTPTFSVDVSDPDSSQQVKARFSIWQNDGTTLVGTVDSAFRTGAGIVTAEYASALPVGTYRVSAIAIDDLGLVSTSTGHVAFDVTQQSTLDRASLWDVRAFTNVDRATLWDVQQTGVKDVSTKWNVLVSSSKDVSLKWDVETPWVSPAQLEHIWTEVSV